MPLETTPQLDSCPQRSTLRSFLEGALPPDEIDAVAAHLHGCPQCVTRLAEFETTQAFRNNHAPTGDFLDEEGSRRLVERLQRQGRVDLEPLPRLSDGGPAGRVVLGRFEVHEVIGAGGTATVYRAFDPITEREVALKVPHLQVVSSGRRRERFLREARAVARLHHPAIVPVFEAGDDERQCHLVSELCPGGSLRQYLDAKRAPLPPRTAARIVAQLADAVQHAHQMGVLHRDIKPGNILLTAVEAGDGTEWLADRVKLADFGLAGFADTSGTTTSEGAVLGSIRYMSPEQVEGRSREIDARTDVHALGAVLYELLTLHAPYDAPTTAEMIHRITARPPRPQPLLDADVPRDLAAICMRALEKEPALRYPSAAELRDDLRRFLEGRPTIARPLRSHERLARWVRQNRAVAFLIGLTMLLLAGVAVVSLVAARQARRHAGELETALTRAERGEFEARQLAYISDMRFAFQHSDQGLLLDAHTLLQRQVASDAVQDLRGLEWRVLRARIDGRLFTIGHHGSVASDVDFFPDGRTLATAGEDGVIRIWDGQTGAAVREFAVQPAPLYAVAVSPDGKWIAWGSGSRMDDAPKHVTVIDANSGAVLGRLNVHDTTIKCIRFSPDGRFLASGSADEKVSVWRFSNGLAGGQIDLPIEGDALVHEIQFLDGGAALLTVDFDRTGFRVWDCLTGEAVQALPVTMGDTVDYPSMSSRADVLAFSAGYRGGRLALIDPRDGRILGGIELGEVIMCLDMHPAGDRVCVGTENGKVHVLSLRTAAGAGDARRLDVDRSEAIQIHHGAISRIRFYDDDHVVTVGVDGRVVRFRIDDASKVGSHLPASVPVSQMAPSPDGRISALAGADGCVRIVDRTTENVLAVSRPLESPPNDLAWSPDGTRLAAICETGNYGCWHWNGATLVEEINSLYRETPNTGQCVAFSGDGRELYIGGTNPDGVEIRDLETNTVTDFVETLYGVSTLAVTPDNNSILAAHEGVFVVDRESRELRHYLSAGGNCTALSIAGDGRTLVVGYRDGVVRLWDLETGALERVLPEYDRSDSQVEALLFSDDGRTLVAGDIGGRVRFWNTAAWDFCGSLPCFAGEDDRIQAMSIGVDGDNIEVLVGNLLDRRRLEVIPLAAVEPVNP